MVLLSNERGAVKHHALRYLQEARRAEIIRRYRGEKPNYQGNF